MTSIERLTRRKFGENFSQIIRITKTKKTAKESSIYDHFVRPLSQSEGKSIAKRVSGYATCTVKKKYPTLIFHYFFVQYKHQEPKSHPILFRIFKVYVPPHFLKLSERWQDWLSNDVSKWIATVTGATAYVPSCHGYRFQQWVKEFIV